MKNKQKTEKLKSKKSIINMVMIPTTIIITIFYLLYILLTKNDITIDYYYLIIAILMFILTILISLISITASNQKTNIIIAIALSIIILFTGFSYIDDNYLNFNNNTNHVINLNNKNLASAIKWADNNNITLEQKYENSDIIPLNYVIGQSISPGTTISKSQTMMIYISSGPDYNKNVEVMNMVSWPLKDVVKYIKDNHLSNVEIDYIYHDSIKRDNLISQSKVGQMIRKDPLKLVFSIGPKGSLKPIKMINLKTKSLFDANLWLKRNGFLNYLTKEEFSSKIAKGHITSQNKTVGTIIDPLSDNILLGISKGQKISVPNIMEMTTSEISAWIVKNKLKLNLSDAYDSKITEGKIIKSSVKIGDGLVEGDTVTITVSKGPLSMIDSTNLSAIITWANKYNIRVSQSEEYSTKPSGTILNISHKAGQVIQNGDVITIKISQGTPITVPNFVGKSKSSIVTSCRSLGLNCSYVYGGYSSVKKDYAIKQSISSGSKVMKGTYIKVTLSSGPALTKTLNIQTTLLGGGYTTAVNNLKSYFSKEYPGVYFTFEGRLHNSLGSGQLHPDSPSKTGTSVTQGKTYKVILVK